ncbi:hypothetical protein P7K49_035785 [Saguinus oedipus]|uniref:Ig-like domain-containing protein n=1 Tax=Saguinus oedipus TaxID=9490 RepID=A0ABQ9TNL8_SAGOE|nr:hypothetical protein P7K49_035785 [Saguinus oedipus]
MAEGKPEAWRPVQGRAGSFRVQTVGRPASLAPGPLPCMCAEPTWEKSMRISQKAPSLPCPVPRIKWRKVDGSLSPQWATAEPTLQIPSVSFEDEGTYECEAENSKGRDTVQGRIIVQGTELGTPSPPLLNPLPALTLVPKETDPKVRKETGRPPA